MREIKPHNADTGCTCNYHLHTNFWFRAVFIYIRARGYQTFWKHFEQFYPLLEGFSNSFFSNCNLRLKETKNTYYKNLPIECFVTRNKLF